MHINKLDDSKYRVLRGELATETKRTDPPVLPCSLLELQSPDMLRPASPPFGFLIVAANCAFQDFVLGRQDARGEKERGEEKKRLEFFLPFLGRLCPAPGGKTARRHGLPSDTRRLWGIKRGAPFAGPGRGRSHRPWERSRVLLGSLRSAAQPGPALFCHRCLAAVSARGLATRDRDGDPRGSGAWGKVWVTVRSVPSRPLPWSGKEMGTGKYQGKTPSLRPPKPAPKPAEISPECAVGPTRNRACTASPKPTLQLKIKKVEARSSRSGDLRAAHSVLGGGVTRLGR